MSDRNSVPTEIIVKDALDREVVFTELPQRIVIAGRATALVADAFFLFPEAAEQIAPLETDLVILKSAMAEKLGTPLEAIGIKVVYVDLETPGQFDRDITAMGQLLGNPGRAEEILAFFQARVDAISAKTDGLADDARPRVLLLRHSEEGGEVAFNAPPEGWLQTTLVRIAGRPLAEYGRRELSRQIALVPQAEHIPFDFTVLEYVLLGRSPYLGMLEMPGPADYRVAQEAMNG